MEPRLIESVPNISEGPPPGGRGGGRRGAACGARPARARRAIRPRPQPQRLDPRGRRRGALRGAARACSTVAVERIDLRGHQGEHPRLGAVDVVPFIPIEGATMADCVALARRARPGGRGALTGCPSSSMRRRPPRPTGATSRTSAAASSRGSPRRCATRPGRPDFGPPRPIPPRARPWSARACRSIAYNINLGTADLEIARRIAKAIRHSSGGYRHVKAMGVMLEQRQPGPGLDQHDRLQAHAAAPRVRDRAVRGRASRGARGRQRDRGPRPRGGPLRRRRALPPPRSASPPPRSWSARSASPNSRRPTDLYRRERRDERRGHRGRERCCSLCVSVLPLR